MILSNEGQTEERYDWCAICFRQCSRVVDFKKKYNLIYRFCQQYFKVLDISGRQSSRQPGDAQGLELATQLKIVETFIRSETQKGKKYESKQTIGANFANDMIIIFSECSIYILLDSPQ